MKKNIVFCLVFSFFIFGCNNKDIFNLTSFDGYTSRNFEGFLVGTEDETDWKLNDEWKRNERNLFTAYDSYTYDCANDESIEIKALPNPTSQFVYISMIKDSTVKFDYRIVNEDWEVLKSGDDITDNSFSVDVIDLVDDEIVIRMYYRFKKSDNCAFIGHGDIRIN